MAFSRSVKDIDVMILTNWLPVGALAGRDGRFSVCAEIEKEENKTLAKKVRKVFMSLNQFGPCKWPMPREIIHARKLHRDENDSCSVVVNVNEISCRLDLANRMWSAAGRVSSRRFSVT